MLYIIRKQVLPNEKQMNINDIRLREIELFLSLVRLKSVRELARQEAMQPGQVSKWIAGLERKIGSKLIERSATGIRMSARGLELLPVFEKLHTLQLKLEGESVRSGESIFSIASSSFLSTHLLPLIIPSLTKNSKVKIIDLPPTSFVAAALRGAFDYCLHSRNLAWPETWTTTEVGKLRWNIYARKNHPVLKNTQRKNIIRYPFVTPIYWTSEGTQYGDDQCPIPFSERIKGHETATAASAAEIVKATDQLAFLPEIIVSKIPDLKIVKLAGKKVEQPLFLSVRNMTVKQSDFELISQALRKTMHPYSATPQ
jgi:DNA-binding transcriptional LysR family regulator